MQNTNTTTLNRKKLQSYQQSQVLGLDPIRLLLKVYDFTILNCKKNDVTKASKGLVELISALNFDYAEMCLGLFRLYQYCMDRIKVGEFDEATEILQGLRESWAKTLPARS
ncbi:flagellar protein FliS [candidate division KSB1 bacterium]|nr:flagellar protein FliS [candidate division KSB1 bacterium]MCH8285966.1 flagellar protein FliS [candidate division KSB1 bacterium]